MAQKSQKITDRDRAEDVQSLGAIIRMLDYINLELVRCRYDVAAGAIKVALMDLKKTIPDETSYQAAIK